jgi:hypothetical protein
VPDAAEISRAISELLNCVAVVASDEAYGAVRGTPRERELLDGLRPKMTRYFELAARMRAGPRALLQGEGNLRFVRAAVILEKLGAAVDQNRSEEELRRLAQEFLNAFFGVAQS